MYISYVNTVAKAHLFSALFSQLTIFTADCLCHPIQMVGIETIWELHILTVINSCVYIIHLVGQFTMAMLTDSHCLETVNKMSLYAVVSSLVVLFLIFATSSLAKRSRAYLAQWELPPRKLNSTLTDGAYQWLCYSLLVSQALPTKPSADHFEYTCPVCNTESYLCCGWLGWTVDIQVLTRQWLSNSNNAYYRMITQLACMC